MGEEKEIEENGKTDTAELSGSEVDNESQINFEEVPIIEIEQPQEISDATNLNLKVEAEKIIPEETEEDLLLISESLWKSPHMFCNRVTTPDDEAIKSWNHQLFLYCQRKGINVFDYVFDELGIIIATVTMAAPMYRDFKNNPEKIKKENIPVADISLEEYREQKEKEEEENEQ